MKDMNRIWILCVKHVVQMVIRLECWIFY